MPSRARQRKLAKPPPGAAPVATNGASNCSIKARQCGSLSATRCMSTKSSSQYLGLPALRKIFWENSLSHGRAGVCGGFALLPQSRVRVWWPACGRSGSNRSPAAGRAHLAEVWLHATSPAGAALPATGRHRLLVLSAFCPVARMPAGHCRHSWVAALRCLGRPRGSDPSGGPRCSRALGGHRYAGDEG